MENRLNAKWLMDKRSTYGRFEMMQHFDDVEIKKRKVFFGNKSNLLMVKL